MLPKNIIFVSLMSFIPEAYSAYRTFVKCANNTCKQRALELFPHPYPPISKCGEPLGIENCKNDRYKTYYKCDTCGAISIKNQVVHRGDPDPPCIHRGKKLFLGPCIPTPSEASSQPSSSAGVTPSRIVGGKTYFMFLPEDPPSS
ncbi:hypothetical protein PGTUg99_019571 [Puccinia graminis f. sp. tritici]|uniref:Uncharacterized protein n=1 Tax=Puccinia graminis f. sp. tritici TaxID=56615 RepID=A0A5B0QQN4_PUCGR|nr:hypothetical protein PGTUg99_027867 [Puccinia graminis f. sp. tritici]KAA1115646.1 hypothetical protein PGTUg99_019571 [Puccinia graminis f. sp. tritici]